MSSLSQSIARRVLELAPAYPSPEYLPLGQLTTEIALNRAAEEARDEREGGLLKFFPTLPAMLPQLLLDLGSGFGGRTVEFAERFGCAAIGIEIDRGMCRGAAQFAHSRGSDSSFLTGVGEAIPLADNTIDLILSYDVLEHVQYPERVIQECYRVLTPGGLLCLVFPPYYHPTGAHLEGYCSRMPYANVLFSSPTLINAVDEVLSRRDSDYRPQSLRSGDKLYSLNGLTIRKFRKILQRSDFEVESLHFLPLFSKVNQKYDAWKMKYYAWAFKFFAKIPLLNECLTHRVVAVLRKPE